MPPPTSVRSPPSASPAAPEVQVRRRLHRAGLRYRLRGPELPGHPDIVLPRRRSVVFVLDCFWHGHDCTLGRAAPKFKVGTWAEKIAANRDHDREHGDALRAAGWHVETVWECQVERRSLLDRLAARLLKR